MINHIIKIIIDIMHSDWIQFIYGTGFFWGLLVSTKTGNNILSMMKHCFYCVKNPPIIYSASFNFEFDNVNTNEISNLAKDIYKSENLSKYKLKRNGNNANEFKLHYPGLDYIFEIENNDEFTTLTINIKETESNYNNLNGHIKNIVIGAFMKEIVLSKILEIYTTSQFKSNYQFNLKFSEKKYNFFLKERFVKTSKGYVSSALITIKDKEDEDFILDADLNGMCICVKNNFDKFLTMLSKYVSII